MATSDSQSTRGSSVSDPREAEKTITPQQTLPASTPRSSKIQTQESFLSKTRRHLTESVRPSTFAEIELLILTFCTGIQGKHYKQPSRLTNCFFSFLFLFSFYFLFLKIYIIYIKVQEDHLRTNMSQTKKMPSPSPITTASPPTRRVTPSSSPSPSSSPA